MSSPDSPDQIRWIAHELVVLPGFRNAYVQIIMTRGRPPIGSRDIRLCKNRFQAFSMPYMWVAPPEVQARGMSLHTSKRVRVPPQSVDPLVKHYHWLDFQMGLFEAYDVGAETVILQDLNGYVTEGPGFNIFAEIDGRLVTPQQGVLDGMTRRTTFELCRDLGIEVAEGKYTPEQLRSANEVFLTSTAGGIIPVTHALPQFICLWWIRSGKVKKSRNGLLHVHRCKTMPQDTIQITSKTGWADRGWGRPPPGREKAIFPPLPVAAAFGKIGLLLVFQPSRAFQEWVPAVHQ